MASDAAMCELKQLVAANVARFRVLVDWDVVVRKDGDHLGSVTVHPDFKRALVRPPEPGTDVVLYAIHEVLHVAMAAVRRADDAHEAEELLVQDLCVAQTAQSAIDTAAQDEKELARVREDVETTMHDFAHSAEAALCEDPPCPEYASAMETACVRLRAILFPTPEPTAERSVVQQRIDSEPMDAEILAGSSMATPADIRDAPERKLNRCAKCKCVLQTMTNKPVPDGTLCMMCSAPGER